MYRPLRLVLASLTFVAVIVVLGSHTRAQTVWSGFNYSFAKANFANTSLPENQDRITSSVWITRSTNQGIFNIHDEAGYIDVSPAGTRWATELNNPGKTIAAANWSNLTFVDWVTAYGGRGSFLLPSRLLANNAVVYLVADNIYLDLRFTSWTGSGGGGFAYDRAPAPPLSPTGDYNLNGVVDAADYVLWRDTLSQTASPFGSGADGNANGTIDSGDFDFWRARFGNTAGTGTISAGFSVPEPGGFALLVITVLTGRLLRRKRQ